MAVAGIRKEVPPIRSILWGHHPAFVEDKLGFVSSTARDYGDAVPLRFGPLRFWLVSDPALIGEVMTTKAASFRKDAGLRRAKVLLGEGLLTSEDPEHAGRSRLAQPSFRAKAVETYADAMVGVTEEVTGSWKDGARIALAHELSRLTLTIVARALFGSDLLERSSVIERAVAELFPLLDRRMHGLVPLPLWVPTPDNRRFVRALAVLDDVVYEMIRERRRAPGGRNDLLSGWLQAGSEGEGGLTDRQLRDEVMTLFLAGHETTASTLGFTLWLLAANPAAGQVVRTEVDTVLGERRATAADMGALPQTLAAIEESMRLYPPAWFIGRQAAEPVELGGGRLKIRKRDIVGMSPYVVHRDPRWFADPLVFRPERFARNAVKPVPFAYFPFGIGKRSCIGRSFALLEATLVLATILQKVELELDTTRELPLEAPLTMRPAGGLPAVVRVRVPAAV